MDKKAKDVLFILVLASVCTLLLLGIKSCTYPVISRYKEFTFKAAILQAAGIDYTEDNFAQNFTENIRKVESQDITYYLSPKNYYIFEFEGRGLWGPINGIITLRPDLETIESIRIISQEETPGLGARIAEQSFLKQFVSKKFSPYLKISSRKKAIKDNEIDSISGASMTSSALIAMINESVDKIRGVIE